MLMEIAALPISARVGVGFASTANVAGADADKRVFNRFAICHPEFAAMHSPISRGANKP